MNWRARRYGWICGLIRRSDLPCARRGLNFRRDGSLVLRRKHPRAHGCGAETRRHSGLFQWMEKNALSTPIVSRTSWMNSLGRDSQQALQCPTKEHWVSVRWADEHGAGTAVAGLGVTIEDIQKQQYSGVLDEAGFSGKIRIYWGPALLSFTTSSNSTDIWYKTLITSDSYPLPITALHIAA